MYVFCRSSKSNLHVVLCCRYSRLINSNTCFLPCICSIFYSLSTSGNVMYLLHSLCVCINCYSKASLTLLCPPNGKRYSMLECVSDDKMLCQTLEICRLFCIHPTQVNRDWILLPKIPHKWSLWSNSGRRAFHFFAHVSPHCVALSWHWYLLIDMEGEGSPTALWLAQF